MTQAANRRILVVDDQEAIRDDFKKILLGEEEGEKGLRDARSLFFGGAEAEPQGTNFELVLASQGDEGIQLLERTHASGEPFAMAFVDIRMPPGPDGMETIEHMWRIEPRLQVVICTAYSDYTFEQIIERLGHSDQLLILKKPFDPVEVRQLAEALTAKWNIQARNEAHVRELEVANERALAASRAKSEFLANMSHEIRTPMHAILGYVDLLAARDLTEEEFERYAEVIRRSGEHLLIILSDILDLSRIEAGRMPTTLMGFSPMDLAREAATLLRTQALEKDLDLHLRVRGALPTSVISDPVRVRQVLLNLLGNAVKFTAEGSVDLVLALEPGRGGGHDLVFEIADTGPGIAREDLPRLFDAFFQVDASTTREVGGAGLGLAISSRLARLLGGRIDVESTVGRGSTFTFRLPLGAGADLTPVTYRDDDLSLESAAVGEERPDEFHGRVLLVEDVDVNRALIQAVLRKAGADVVTAVDGLEGYRAAQEAEDEQRPFDIVLMDMQMPVMDGYEATRKLRSEGYRRPIVALTAHAMTGDRERCFQAGCTDYVTKPVDRRVLIDICRRLRSLERPPAALPRKSEHEPKR